MESKKILIWLCIIFFFFFLRLYHLKDSLNFSADQGEAMLRVWQIWKNKEITLIGPAASPEIFHRQFFQGPLIYYQILATLLLSGWDPLRSSYLLIILNFTGLLFLYQALLRLINRQAALSGIIMFTFFPAVVEFSRFHFGPNTLLFLMPMYIMTLVYLYQKPKAGLLFLLGFLGGLSLQFHFQIVLIVTLTLLWLAINYRKINWLLFYCLGVGLGYMPLIIFDIRHQFYNINTIWLWLTYAGNNNPGHFNIHYFLAFLPFVFTLIAYFLEKIRQKYNWLPTIILSFFIAISLYFNLRPKNAFGMPAGWSYPSLIKTTDIVLAESGSNYNIVNLLSGDTRFYSMRYLLTIQNKPPLPVDQYPRAEELFVVSYKSADEVLNHPVWELQSFLPAKVVNSWSIGRGISLFHVKKTVPI
jgi:hypothetical protein